MEYRDPMIQQRRSLIGFAKLIVFHPTEALPVQQTDSQDGRSSPVRANSPQPTPPTPAATQS